MTREKLKKLEKAINRAGIKFDINNPDDTPLLEFVVVTYETGITNKKLNEFKKKYKKLGENNEK